MKKGFEESRMKKSNKKRISEREVRKRTALIWRDTFFGFINRFGRVIDPELLEGATVHFGQNDARMGLEASKFRELSHRELGQRIGDGRDRKSDENLIETKLRIMAAEA